MKKLISLLLAVSALTMSTSAFAYDNLEAGSNRNDSTAFANSAASLTLPAYRPGDTLVFSIPEAANLESGDIVTFISSKYEQSGSTYSNATVQYIDQKEYKPVDSENFSTDFKVRDLDDDGIYKIEIKAGDNEVATFYYLVGDPKVELLTIDADGEQKYLYRNGSAYYFGRATIGNGVDFNKVGAEIGFIFDTNEDKEFTADDEKVTTNNFQALAESSVGLNSEIEGEGQYFFALEVYDAVEAELPDVDVYLND